MRIFLSAVSAQFTACRDALASDLRAIGSEVRVQEDFQQGPRTLIERLEEPVVGICWYEARAYCAWLSAQTGQPHRLPTEAEWEAAVRGREGRRYAWRGDFDSARCNVFETHVRGTTPLGVSRAGTPAMV